jgi:hypothetical protein
MIPDKLYIPTTTLNFNNIMASESISPAGFYPVRGFGYKRFDKVKPNNLDKRIILYDKYPIFDINDIELENYPLVIMVTRQHIGEDIICEYKDGVFYAEETIYLNPFSTKIYFRNEDEKRRTFLKVEQSLNTKMVPIYQNDILVKTLNVNYFEWKNNDITDSAIDFSKHISKDRRINKLKGLLYAYLFGANRSLPPEVVASKKLVKKLQNLLSAIITNPDGYVNYKQEEELRILYRKINETFYQVEGLEKILQNRIKQKEEQYHCSNFAEILKKEDLYDTWYQKQNLKPSYRINPFNLSYSHKSSNKKDSEYNNNKSEETQKYFDAYFSELEKAIDKHLKSANTNVLDLPILQHCNRVEGIPSDKTGFQTKLFNEYCEEHWNSEEFLASRLDFATAGGKLFREELQDSWENSSSKSYINDLRKNLASHTPFTLNSVTNLTLQSFAVFCKKGEEDIDKLEDYLISNGIGDFRIAFSLWGIVFGFANMPKTLANDLFLSNDRTYKSDVYKYIFKQIHGIELEGEFESKEEKEVVVIPSQLNGDMNNNKPEAIATDNNIHNEDPSLELENKLRSLELKLVLLKDIKDKYEQHKYNISNLLFDDIGKIRGVGTKTLQKIKDALGHVDEDLKSTQLQSEPPLPLHQSTGLFLSDFDFLSSDNEFIVTVSHQNKDWKKDLKWFIESHKISHKDYNKYWKDKPTDNESIIKQFIFFKEEIYKSSEDLLRRFYFSNE